MHRCLSCNQTCSISSIFCDACRLSLLERSTELIQESQPELVKTATREDGAADLFSTSQEENSTSGLVVRQSLEDADAPTDKAFDWSLKTSGIYSVEAVDGMTDEEIEKKPGNAQSTNVLLVPPPTKRVMPRRVRRALLIFCIVGSLALLTDGVLLALSLTRHHAPTITQNTLPNAHGSQANALPPSGQPNAGTTPNSAHEQLLSTARLSFTATKNQTNVEPQTVTLFGDGENTFSWTITASKTLPTWLHLSAMQGRTTTGTQATFTVNVQAGYLAPGTYTATVMVKAFGNHNTALANSPETLTVVLNVRPPCTLNVTPVKLSFSVGLLSTPIPQTLTLQESANCSFPVSWQASADVSWITFSRSSGTDKSGGDTLSVAASSNGQLIGTYTAHITIEATDSSGSPVEVTPATITVTLSVLG